MGHNSEESFQKFQAQTEYTTIYKPRINFNR